MRNPELLESRKGLPGWSARTTMTWRVEGHGKRFRPAPPGDAPPRGADDRDEAPGTPGRVGENREGIGALAAPAASRVGHDHTGTAG